MKNLLKWSVLLLFFTSTTFLNAAEIYVDINASGSNDGQSWTNAFTDLQDALAVAGNGDEIWVANGVYKPTTTTDRDISFNIPDGVELYGGFAGGETNRVDRDWQTNASIISGAIGSQVDVTDNTRELIRISNADDVVISGFKIQRAYDESNSNIVILNSSNVRFRQCDFRTHTSGGYAIYMQFSAVEYKDCLFRDIDSFAAVMAAANDTELSILNCTVAQNDGFNFIWSSFDGSDVSLLNSIVAENTFSGNIISSGNSSQAENCVITSPNLGFSSTTNISSDDPMFEDPATNNFRLLSGSPAIGFGNTSFTSQGLDLAHEFRISGADVDAGCYELDVATRWYVDEDASGLDNGTSWTNAFNDLQDALAVAEEGDQVWVAEGTYYPTTGSSRSVRFVLANDVKLYGGFDGTETALEQRNWIDNLTILSGDIGTPNVQTDNSYHVVMAANASGNSHIDGFVIEEGYANSGTLNGDGGGISIQATSDCEIKNCWLRNNFALRGGGIHVRLTNGEVTISQSVFQFNEGNEGAGLYFDDDVEIESCFFSGNTTNTSGTVYGVAGFDLNMTNCTLFNNTVPDLSRVIDGNGTNDSWEIVNSIIWANSIDNNLEPIRNVGPGTDVRLSIVQNGHTGGTMVFDQDPMFMNPGGGDFGLQPSSVGFNAGDDSVVEEELDAVRNDRIRAGQVDFGAVESSGAPASVIYVDQDATGANDGSSWANAYTSLYDGLAAAVDGDHVWVAEGTYIATSSYFMAGGVQLHGGFNGTETLLSEADWNANETIISGDAGIAGVQTDNTDGLLRITLNEIGATVSGFILEDNYAQEGVGTLYSAMTVSSVSGFEGDSEIDIENCVFRYNVKVNWSISALTVSNSNPSNSIDAKVENCLFHHNESSVLVASTGNSQVVLTYIGCTFTENSQEESFGSVVEGDFIYNSIVTNNYGSENSFSNIVGDNNIYQGGSITGSNNLVADPSFVDPSNDDFSLLPSSPAIGMGDNAQVTTTFDVAHNDRIQFGSVDAGALESAFEFIAGCLDETACNFNVFADEDDGSCEYPGCIDAAACNYDPAAGCDDGSCIAPLWYLPNNVGDGPIVLACSEPAGYFLADQACAQEIVDNDPYCVDTNWDAICERAYNCCIGAFGCRDFSACNFDNFACEDNSLCVYATCDDVEACNYDPEAACGDLSLCEYDCIPVVPGVVYVDQDATDGANDGSSWFNAFLTIYDALAVVDEGEEVWVAEGEYFVSGTDNEFSELVIGNDVGMFGGFEANETARNQRNWELHETIVNGELGDPMDDTDNTQIMIRFVGGLDVSVVDGFTFENAHSDLAPNFISNGATCGYRNCKFLNNGFPSYLISMASGATATMDNCLIANNFNTTGTGVLFSAANDAQVDVINTTIADNDGLALAATAGSFPTFELENCIVWGHDFNFLMSGLGLSIRNSISDDEVFTGVDENVVHLDPLFVGGGDYSLQAGSPAIGLGENAEVFSPLDLAFNTRVQNAGVDAGAYESPFTLAGCTDMTACNYNPNADTDDGSCTGPCAPACLGDFNNDGFINASDLLVLLAAFNSNCGFPFCEGDMNGDTAVDTSDLLAFLGVFGTACP